MKRRPITIEYLAHLTQKGFLELGTKMDKGFAEVDKRFAEVDKKIIVLAEIVAKFARSTEENFRHVNARLDRIRDDIADLPAMREELYDLRGRVERLERKVGAAK